MTSSPVDASVLIVSYRTPDDLEACLDSLYESRPSVSFEVIVVDNASGDDSVHRVRRAHPDVEVVELEENIGFGRAVNQGVASAEGEWLVLLNPDTVVHEGALDALVGFARDNPAAGLVGGRTLRDDGTLEPSSCWDQPTLFSLACFASGASWAFRGHPRLDPEAIGGWDRDTVREVGVITGCWLAASRTLWDELGGFDERFFMYGEDIDLSRRARAIGYSPTITPDAVITHRIGASSAASADRRVLVLTGRMTVVQTAWSGWRRRVGAALLVGGVGVRAAFARFGRGEPTWLDAWRRQDEWRSGYPSPNPRSNRQ